MYMYRVLALDRFNFLPEICIVTSLNHNPSVKAIRIYFLII